MANTLSQRMVYAASFFQGIAAAFLAAVSVAEIGHQFDFYTPQPGQIYRFLSALFNLLFTLGIFFIVIIQLPWHLPHPYRPAFNPSKRATLGLEIGKSGLATATWLDVLLTQVITPVDKDRWRPMPKSFKIEIAALLVLVLFVLFYPTLVWAVYDFRTGDAVVEENVEGQANEDNAGEETPLLAAQT